MNSRTWRSKSVPDEVEVRIDESQFPEAVSGDLVRGLRRRQLNHKFHYDSVKQTVKWLELYEQYSPFRNDPACQRTYERAFRETASQMLPRFVHVVGLGSGSGQKDIRLVQMLRRAGRKVTYTPSDVSIAMALIAWRHARLQLKRDVHSPLVFDLATTRHLRDLLRRTPIPTAKRIVTFLGMIPNFEPNRVLTKLAGSLNGGDYLIASANLLPRLKLKAGLRRVLPQYDNRLTREWLSLALSDLGIKAGDGKIGFRAREIIRGGEIIRIEARFRFARSCCVRTCGERFPFRRGDSLRLFFSDRYTPQSLAATFRHHGFHLVRQWLVPSGEEGVFFLRKERARASRRLNRLSQTSRP